MHPVVSLRLCGFGVNLSAEAEVGQFCTDRVCQSGHKLVSHADDLPSEPRQLMTTLVIIAECYRNAAMRFTANKNVALPASPIAA